jgi:hypothetical protein
MFKNTRVIAKVYKTKDITILANTSKDAKLRLTTSLGATKVAGIFVMIAAIFAAAIVPSGLLQPASAQFLTLEPPATTPTAPATTGTPSPNATATAGDLGPLKVEVLLFGVDKKPGQIVTFVTANNVTKAFGGNSAELDRADNITDGIADVFFTFPEITPKVGDKFEACSIVLEDRSLMCGSGFKSPANVTETVQLLVTDQGSALE